MYGCEDSDPEASEAASLTAETSSDDGRGRSERPASPGSPAKTPSEEVDVAIIGERGDGNMGTYLLPPKRP